MRQTGKNVSPMSNEGRNTYVINHITDALIQLMEQKPISNISVSELCELAGVGRASFYRNFETKEAVLEKYLEKIWHEWAKDYESKNEESYFIESILKCFYKYKEFNRLLYRHNLSNLIYEVVRWGAKIDESANNVESYIKSMAAGFVFGLADEWMRRGMQETPEQILILAAQLDGQQKQVQ